MLNHPLKPASQPRVLPVLVAAVLLFVLNLVLNSGAYGQATSQAATVQGSSASLPTLVRFNGRAADSNGKPITNVVGITFSLYAQEGGGAALWLETQNVQPDAGGHYTVLLGASKPEGLPSEVFVSGQARWVGAQVSGQVEQPRVMLLAVPYAMKAGDAATVGGLPPSAFMLAAPVAGSSAANSSGVSGSSPSAATAAVSGTGTTNFVPLWTSTSNLGNSALFQTGSGTTAKLGINTITPASALDVKGGGTIRGLLNLPAIGAATATAGKNSQPFSFVASSFNSGTSAAVNQTFQWQVEALGNNTTAPSGSLNLLFGQGSAKPTETGVKLSNKGIFTFATGQTFPGTLTGVTPGTDLTGGGGSGNVTLNLDTTKVPQLASNNTFKGAETFSGNVGVGVAPSGTNYTPLSISSATTFGTWFALGNTSAGGHTWNIISAGSGNAEGAGNFGITDLTGKSTIWLEGNTNTASLAATGTINGASVTAAGSAGGAILDADVFGKNNGAALPGLRFGGAASGEGIASNRAGGTNAFGLQLFTEFTPRVSILQNGQVGMGISNPAFQLDVFATSSAYSAIRGFGGTAANGSGGNGSSGVYGNGGNGDLTSTTAFGGNGVFAEGGIGGGTDGDGGVFFGGNFSSFGDGIFSSAGSANSWAGFFQGNVGINGVLSGGSVSFKIDHPLDPANKYLSHSTVQSPDMLDIYNGNVVTDANGDAVVALPDWFESLNRDFRYQLTVIGQFAQAIISSEVANHQFSIKTDKPGVKVSWLVTGVRQDAWANAHRTPVEEQKTARERGHYLSPEVYGAPEETSIESARHPEIMRRLQAIRQQKQAPLKSAPLTIPAPLAAGGSQ